MSFSSQQKIVFDKNVPRGSSNLENIKHFESGLSVITSREGRRRKVRKKHIPM